MYQKTLFDVREQIGLFYPPAQSSVKLLPQLCWSIVSEVPGFPCRMSTHPFHELVYISKGSGTMHINEGEYQVSEGHLLLVNPGERHCNFTEERNTCTVNYIAFSLGERWMDILTSLIGCCRLPNRIDTASMAVSSFLDELNFCLNRKGPFWQQFVSFRLGAFFMQLLPVVDGKPLLKIQPSGLANRVSLILQAHPEQRFTVADLARQCSLSRSYFCRSFKKETGENPSHFVLRQKLRQAREMLRLTSRKIADIASSLGFEDEFHFSKVFKRYAGISPSHYRRRILA